jgi:hypothetical protein
VYVNIVVDSATSLQDGDTRFPLTVYSPEKTLMCM